jgi:hypothetical protein
VLPREALMRVLWRQRAYADRTGAPFVFVRIRRGGRDAFARAACRLCRASDAVGRYGENGSDLGILLPNATPQGALRVVRELEALFRARAGAHSDPATEIACDLFVYPGTSYAPVVDWPLRELETERA